ncbi:MAG: metallophosphoesterase family protein [Chakrabartia sp.]
MVFKRLFNRKEQNPVPQRLWSLPEGERAYAIGDIHGRLDLFNRLLAAIDADDAARAPARTTLILLGDLADRGPDSRGVIERAMGLVASSDNIVCLMGNHEELLTRVWDGERSSAGTFNRVGGRETLLSYGVTPEDYDQWDLGEMTEATGRVVPEAHIDFLRSFKDWHQMGDYLFVHAGIRPGHPIEDQDATDLRWIRREFTESDADHGVMVIHGHTITENIDERHNRIGIDTGAFGSDVLTAIGLEGTERWFLET